MGPNQILVVVVVVVSCRQINVYCVPGQCRHDTTTIKYSRHDDVAIYQHSGIFHTMCSPFQRQRTHTNSDSTKMTHCRWHYTSTAAKRQTHCSILRESLNFIYGLRSIVLVESCVGAFVVIRTAHHPIWLSTLRTIFDFKGLCASQL